MTKQLHIIIEEDDIDDAETILQSFEKNADFTRVDVVLNGQELLDYLESEESKPDVILTDINMPIVNGIEALEAISKSAEHNKIPLFIYSTTVNPAYEEQCKKMGSRAFLIKPFTLKEFDEIPFKIVNELEKSSVI